MMKKIVWISIVLLLLPLLFAGCGLKSHYYVLSGPSEIPVQQELRGVSIGVEQVEVPEYLFKREIAVANSNSEISFLPDAVWAEDLNTGLTRRLIAYLQKRFDQPHVYSFPWELEKQPDLKAKVQISRFAAQGERVLLDASWEVKDLKRSKTVAGLFHKEVPTDGTVRSIVEAMDRAFGYLEEEIAKGVLQLR